MPSASLPGAPPPKLIDVWYREVFDGNLQQAAREYQSIYLSQPVSAVTPQERTQAALRAGLCFERAGQPTGARAAYMVAAQGFADAPSGADAVLETAVLGWRRVGRQDEGLELKLPALAALGDDPAIAAAAEEAFQSLRRAIAARAAAVKSLEKAAKALAERRLEREAILARLALHGVVLSFPELPPVDPEVGKALSQEMRTSESQDAELQKLVGWLSLHFQERTLEALVARNATRAAREQRCLSAVREAAKAIGGDTLEWGWVQSLIDEKDVEVAAALASRRSVEDRWRRSTLLRRELEQHLGAALEAIRNGPRHKAIGFLEKLRDSLDISAPAWLDDQEMLAARAHGERAYLVLLKGPLEAQTAAQLWRGARTEAERLRTAAAAHVRGVVEESRFARAIAVAGRPMASAVCGIEIDRLLEAAQEAVQRGDAAASVRSLREASWILSRVPEADPEHLRRQAIDHLTMSSTAQPQLDPEGKER